MEPDVSDLAENVANGLPKTATPPLRMSVADAAPVEDVFIDHRRLVQWVLGNDGYFHSDAQIAFSQRKGHHLVVTEGATLSNNTRIASCPMPVTLSVLNALSIDPFSNRGVEFPMSFLRSQSKNPESLQAFYLMEQLIRGSASWWAPYIASLPTVEDVTAMQFEEEADIMWLKGTNLRGGISTQAAKWKDMYLRGSGQLKDLGWSNALDGSYTWYADANTQPLTLTHAISQAKIPLGSFYLRKSLVHVTSARLHPPSRSCSLRATTKGRSAIRPCHALFGPFRSPATFA